jgi:uncharacterized protein YecT (DUF1311 family)
MMQGPLSIESRRFLTLLVRRDRDLRMKLLRLFILLPALVWILCVAEPLHGEQPPPIIPEGWLPALSPSIKSALGALKDANSQAEMNSLSREVAELTDAQLFIVYTRLYERLSPKERTALVAEQTKWLKARSKAARDGVESTGGSLAPLEANNAEVTFTEKRLAELRARLRAAEKKE